MVALLDKPEAVAVQHCVGQIAEFYPQALVYALMISSEDYNFQDSATGHKQREFVNRYRVCFRGRNVKGVRLRVHVNTDTVSKCLHQRNDVCACVESTQNQEQAGHRRSCEELCGCAAAAHQPRNDFQGRERK